MRIITLAALNRKVTLRAYVGAVKLAKQNPDRVFKHGLTTWWETTGEEIVQQFRRGMHDRINEGIPAHKREGQSR